MLSACPTLLDSTWYQKYDNFTIVKSSCVVNPFSVHGLECYEKEKSVSCDSEYCEYKNGTAKCGTFEPFFIPYDYCVVGFGPLGANMEEVSLFIEENHPSRTCSTSRTVFVSV